MVDELDKSVISRSDYTILLKDIKIKEMVTLD